MSIATTATPPIEPTIAITTRAPESDVVDGLVSEAIGDGVGNIAGVGVGVVMVSRTAAKSAYESDVSGVVQIPNVHPPRTIEPSARTATSL